MTNSAADSFAWGPLVRPGGDATFRLWAPGQQHVSVVVDESGGAWEMARSDDGWFALDSNAVQAGEGYLFLLDGGLKVPDPASRGQLGGVHGVSLLPDRDGFNWRSENWQGRPWHEAVIYEIHTGTFTSEGTFAGIEGKLDQLVETGITAIELMPVAEFPGRRGWGYDGVLLFAPHSEYGGAEGLKSLVDRAHERGLMVLLDVVYNHFGPDGNFIAQYAPEFFDASRHTPWGAAIDYTRPEVRSFYVENALYWISEFRMDGLRLDAIDQVIDASTPTILEEIASAVRRHFPGRHIHLTTEDERNITLLHERDTAGNAVSFTAEWNDDIHHAAHVVATGETDGYYADYAHDPVALLARGLAEGFVYQGEQSTYLKQPRGARSAHLPPDAFIDFLQNHDQIGNRALGERLTRLASPEAIEILTAILLLSPHIPLIFMGEEWGAREPFYFFTDFEGELADAVRKGRRNEFKRWPAFSDPAQRETIPDPNAIETFLASRLDWQSSGAKEHVDRLAFVRRLLAVRSREIAPRLGSGDAWGGGEFATAGDAFHVAWRFGSERLHIRANLGGAEARIGEMDQAPGLGVSGAREGHGQALAAARAIFTLPERPVGSQGDGVLPPWSFVAAIEGDILLDE